MEPTWVLSAPGRPHVGPMNLAIRVSVVMLLLCLEYFLQIAYFLGLIQMRFIKINKSISVIKVHAFYLVNSEYNYLCFFCLFFYQRLWWTHATDLVISQWVASKTRNDKAQTMCTWWRHQMETFSALLALCAGTSPVAGEFPAQRPMTRNFDVFFDLHPNERLSKQSWGRWFETPSSPLWRHSNDVFNVL